MADGHKGFGINAGGYWVLRRWVLALWALAGIASLQGIASAQSQTTQFDVASIREIVDGVRVIGEFRSSGLRAEYHGFGIQMLIAEAWNVRPDQVALAAGVSPSTVYPMMAMGRSARIYDIVALAPEGTAPTRDELRLMLQALLATRFKLATHTEKRDTPVYVLVPNGKPKLKSSSGEAHAARRRAALLRVRNSSRSIARFRP